MQADLRVRPARPGVRDDRRQAGRVGRVVQVPVRQPGLVHPGGQHRAPVRGPPVAAVAVELLGRDVLGEPPGHPAVLTGEQVVGAVRLDHPQLAPADSLGGVGDVGQPFAGGVGARIDHRADRGHLDHVAVHQVGPEQPAGQREHGHPAGPVQGVGADAGGAEPQPLAQRPFTRRQGGRLAVGPEQHRRVGDQPLLAGGDVEQPERVGRVLRSRRAQEDHPGAVLRDGDGARRAVAEPTGTGGQLGKVHNSDRKGGSGVMWPTCAAA